MQSSFSLLLVALLSYGAYAQKGIQRPIVTLPSKAQPTTAPKAIDESDHRKECPADFTFVGKQCAKTLTDQPKLVCPPGTVLVDGRCASYIGKESECPVGYIDVQGICRRTLTAFPDLACPEGYILRGKDICVTTVPLPEKKLCPPKTTPKGDNCAATKSEVPEYVCPTGYVLLGKRCQREESFDCTPPRVIADIEEPKKGQLAAPQHIRHGGLGNKGKESYVYRLPVAEPVVQEYVIRKTCKRIITEAARPVCPKGGSFDGKLCLIDVMVPAIFKPGGFKELTALPARECPEGFEQTSKGECITTEDTLPNLFCPIGTIDLGDKCATYAAPKTVCPDGFFLEGKVCVKTIFAAPLVEYTVTYACTGKDCGGHHH